MPASPSYSLKNVLQSMYEVKQPARKFSFLFAPSTTPHLQFIPFSISPVRRYFGSRFSLVCWSRFTFLELKYSNFSVLVITAWVWIRINQNAWFSIRGSGSYEYGSQQSAAVKIFNPCDIFPGPDRETVGGGGGPAGHRTPVCGGNPRFCRRRR
jgi:hypothetical protein